MESRPMTVIALIRDYVVCVCFFHVMRRDTIDSFVFFNATLFRVVKLTNEFPIAFDQGRFRTSRRWIGTSVRSWPSESSGRWSGDFIARAIYTFVFDYLT